MISSPRIVPVEAAFLLRFREVRAAMPALAERLSAEDLAAQSMPDASPGKWHLAHTSWFFEAMILAAEPGYEPVDRQLQQLFNSYYESLGRRVERHERGLMTRPSRDEVLAYRAEIDRRMADRIGRGFEGLEEYLFVLGLHHDQQHQELFLMDLLNLMSRSPLDPAAYETEPRPGGPLQPGRGGQTRFEGGLVDIGHGGQGFAFDNEGPRHRVWLEPFLLDHDLVTNGQWLAFMADGGYRRPELWLADGWAVVKTEGWDAPLYWRQDDGDWTVLGLAGRAPVDPEVPVRHISAYEADAYAHWTGKRLPTEAEWESAVATAPDVFSNLFGEVWQHTASAYSPYPGFRPTEGTASEYNGKFMANQRVLRGGAFATPPGHTRATYRNFFYPHQRWAFMGLRLASDAPAGERARIEDLETARFRAELVAGLSRPEKSVSPKWFYDAAGSELFEDITRLPEYYPTRQEAALLREMAPGLTGHFGDNAVLVEFGSGASEKTRILLDSAPTLQAYVPIDISPDALNAAAASIAEAYPNMEVAPMVGDFLNLAPLPELGRGRRVGFFPGSTIGNLEEDQAVAFLANARDRLGPSSLFILGVDLVKDPAVLVAAYDDAQGVTAAFNRNLLVRANRELGADFDLDGFAHVAVWNHERSRMEMHLRAARDMEVHIGGAKIPFVAGETIHTESSRKFTEASVTAMAEAAGWRVVSFQQSPDPSVALVLLAA
ncbi:MAG: L-histidine N(alpha)-methyltransferase [Brevundimonas subvibrioides]|uniref:L-histidine N(Alpha)-methyltransferase n=1 Tax=Brevundimonas subvibrioides TaxID=74313 RepID=A0A258HM91_9CAUL|nr:ergothioneine biosynthesis protein EgtB [Brevundimonas subvibrioides]OYX57899.1 MAG: L-histidine N(alpha)-methyltransferase [Brevundimonas subvibrioides]